MVSHLKKNKKQTLYRIHKDGRRVLKRFSTSRKYTCSSRIPGASTEANSRKHHLLHEHKKEFMYFKPERAISTLSGKILKLVDSSYTSSAISFY